MPHEVRTTKFTVTDVDTSRAFYELIGLTEVNRFETAGLADFDAVRERVKAGGLRTREFGAGMFLADDPSGNVVEVVRLATP